MVNGRITAAQMEWLLERADELGGNLSAALRVTIEEAQLLRAARADFLELVKEHPEFTIPRYTNEDGQEGTSRLVQLALSPGITVVDDVDDPELDP
jgi:hypothetical protein